jgi:hypothetical protein
VKNDTRRLTLFDCSKHSREFVPADLSRGLSFHKPANDVKSVPGGEDCYGVALFLKRRPMLALFDG